MKPIILRAHEVRQLQETGEVLVVRLIKPQPVARTPNDFCFLAGDYAWRAKGWRSGTVSVSNKPGGPDGFAQENCPLGKPTERRWVREKWGLRSYWDVTDWLTDGVSAADEQFLEYWRAEYAAEWGPDQQHCHWRSPVTMPRWASRDVVEIADVQAKQVQAITEAEAIAAGVRTTFLPLACADGTRVWHVDNYPTVQCSTTSAVDAYCGYFGTVHGPDSWDANPWVWLVRARRVEA